MPLRLRSTLIFALATVIVPPAFAEDDGRSDPTFGDNGVRTVAFDLGWTNSDHIQGMAILPNGRIVLAGDVEHNPSTVGIGLARLMPDGQPDLGFGTPWYLPEGAGYAGARDMVVQPDGRIVVAGAGGISFAESRALVCRFLADGNPDVGFAAAQPNPLAGTGCRVVQPDDEGIFNAVALQPDGRIVLAGETPLNGARHGLVARLDGQGNYDTSFHGDGIHVLESESTQRTELNDIAVTPKGEVVTVGYAFISGNNADWRVFRLRGEDGALDGSFDGDGIRPIPIDLVPDGPDLARAVAVLPDGTLIIGGQASDGAEGTRPAVARLKPDGQFDPFLDGDGLFAELPIGQLIVEDMLVQSDGRIVLAGQFLGLHFFAARILPEGGFDQYFGNGAYGTTHVNFGPHYGVGVTESHAYRIANQGGRLLLAGYANPGAPGGKDFAIARLDNDLIFTDDLE